MENLAGSLKVITFDLGDTLVKVDHMRFCRSVGEMAGVSPESVYDEVFDADLEHTYNKGLLSSREFYRVVLEKFRVDLPYPLFCRLWCEIFDPMEGAEEFLAHLEPRYPLYLLSNTNELHFDYIREQFPAILRPFRSFILSYELCSRKPEPEIYRELVRRAGCAPGEILYLDDKMTYVEGARAEGLQSWQFTSPEEFVRQLKESGVW